MAKHGHVIPNADGTKARCGGPAVCPVCAAEKAALDAAVPEEKGKVLEMTRPRLVEDAPPPVNERLVEMLTGLLDRAKRGELHAVAFASVTMGVVTRPLFSSNGWSNGEVPRETLLGSIELLKARYTREAFD